MQEDHSYGIIIFSEYDDKRVYLLVQSTRGHWGFPKGHAEVAELPKQAALRELKEETGLSECNFIDAPMIAEYYTYRRGDMEIKKTNEYFLASASYKEPSPNFSDVIKAEWVSGKDALERFTYEEPRGVLYAAIELLKTKKI